MPIGDKKMENKNLKESLENQDSTNDSKSTRNTYDTPALLNSLHTQSAPSSK